MRETSIAHKAVSSVLFSSPCFKFGIVLGGLVGLSIEASASSTYMYRLPPRDEINVPNDIGTAHDTHKKGLFFPLQDSPAAVYCFLNNLPCLWFPLPALPCRAVSAPA